MIRLVFFCLLSYCPWSWFELALRGQIKKTARTDHSYLNPVLAWSYERIRRADSALCFRFSAGVTKLRKSPRFSARASDAEDKEPPKSTTAAPPSVPTACAFRDRGGNIALFW